MNRDSSYKQFIILGIGCIILMLGSCGEPDFVPKPRSYFRIQLPKKEYRTFDTTFPYTFEYPVYAKIVSDKNRGAEPYWINVEFPYFRGTLYISYKEVNNNIETLFEDTRSFVTKHIPKADDISQDMIKNDSAKVWGTIYHIYGSGVASSSQFCLTDSTKHFIRGALYFDVPANNDSLSPVLDFLQQDIDRLIKTFRWKELQR